jgi:hypothetical protein
VAALDTIEQGRQPETGFGSDPESVATERMQDPNEAQA